MKLENKKMIKNLSIVIGLFGTLSFYGFNCAPPSFQVANQNDSAILSSNALVPFDDVGSGTLDTKAELPYALLTSEQMFSSFINLTEQPNFSNNIMNEFNIRDGAMSVTSDLKFVNAPMLIAITSLAGEVCNGLVAREAAITDVSQRKYFSNVNFGQAIANFTPANYASTVTQFANSFWGRAPSSEEIQLFEGYRNDFIAAIPAAQVAQAAQTRALALSTCTAMLGSLEVFTY